MSSVVHSRVRVYTCFILHRQCQTFMAKQHMYLETKEYVVLDSVRRRSQGKAVISKLLFGWVHLCDRP